MAVAQYGSRARLDEREILRYACKDGYAQDDKIVSGTDCTKPDSINLDDAVSHGVEREICDGVEVEFAH